MIKSLAYVFTDSMRPCSQVNHVMSKYDHIASGDEAIHDERKGYKVAKRSYLAGLHSLQDQLNAKGATLIGRDARLIKLNIMLFENHFSLLSSKNIRKADNW